jgi:hypothetical protein
MGTSQAVAVSQQEGTRKKALLVRLDCRIETVGENELRRWNLVV